MIPRIILALAISVLVLPVEISYSDNNFIAGIELGSFSKKLNQIPLAAIAGDPDDSGFYLISFGLKAGHRFKKFTLMFDYSTADNGILSADSEDPPYISHAISHFSATAKSRFKSFARISISGSVGGLYSQLKINSTGDPIPIYKYSDSGLLIGTSIRYDLFEKAGGGKAYIRLSYSRAFNKHNCNILAASIGIGSNDWGRIYINYRYAEQTDIYRLHTIILGFDKYF
ncbi:MAG: hypothetical protein GY839_16590, partial [candidate division Zixibacteria bacterium]|nr:hypothetical protein [candidate division Zixibacteria bacterium]